MNCSEMPDTLGLAIIYTGKMLQKSINTDFASLNSEITFEQMRLLYYISKNKKKNIIQQDIANLMNKTKSAILRSLDTLEEKKFLKRGAMLNDRRKNVILLTDKGCEVVNKMHEKFLVIEKELIKGFTKDEQKACMSVLLKIQNKCT